MPKWIKANEDESNVVISSRMRLARNLSNYYFSNKLKAGEAAQVTKEVEDAVMSGNSALKDQFSLHNMKDMDELERVMLIEKHMISRELAKTEMGAVLIKEDETVSIMLNEEDHIRIQTILPGLNLEKAWDIADKVDDVLEERLHYAFDERFGYLTACPTNVGTGMRASIMMHLPALVEMGYMDGVLKAANQIGLAIRGIYGEGSNSRGNIFQISNQLTLGRNEKELFANITGLAKQLVSKEIEARSFLKKNQGIKLEDKIFRSLGTLQSARVMDSAEAMSLLSNVKLGIEMGYIKDISTREIDLLFIRIQPAHQLKMFNPKTPGERDVKRAGFIREQLEKMIEDK
ncbi:protein arginine kinase [Peptoclostridium litorale DSM 5388]|uniref:Protein-arginine kinase n=1 Tax=Peptoclostridium litorale DSM 5388 TaxID=1121324 RepID=A0A069RBC6_PEPLI|nr:protein arginine kinase [Peptoclostridium litorale]KDR94341.1 putative ATP:guanido phosphotransferase [Peptoclostridium litorale DSM 5388]SIO29278.1 protein arginine kinase [Peptoclostridium litorale DSM 5388]